MTRPVVYDPFKMLQTLQDNLNRLFEESLMNKMGQASVCESGTWTPVVDIYEDNDEFIIHAELPGLSQKEVDISINNNTLVLKGIKKFPFEIKEEHFHRLERVYGEFRRDFTLPGTVDIEQIKATFENGLLKILLPKVAVSKPKKISIDTK
jgi:HSP20 family protein